MKIAVLDITSRNAKQYNPSLCKALAENLVNGEVELLAPRLSINPVNFKYRKLFNIVPASWTGGKGRLKRLLRGVESSLNYVYVIIYVAIVRPDILHIQWFPFVEFAGGEEYVLAAIKRSSPKLKIVYTAHNIYPHNLSENGRAAYRTRVLRLDNYIDQYVTHLNSSRKELMNEYGIPPQKVSVAYHGIYVAENYIPTQNKPSNIKRLIMYGFQSRYKGADILIDALNLLPKESLSKLKVKIVGLTDKALYESYSEKATAINVEWINRFVSDGELYQAIGESDLILLPYRKIAQSGVLLLALSYKKAILTSDLPSFKETLEGYPEDCFFESGNPKALADILEQFVNNRIDVHNLIKIIRNLNEKYSWNETAKKTLYIYQTIQ